MRIMKNETDIQRAILKGVNNKIGHKHYKRQGGITSLISVLSLVWALLLIVSAPVLLQTVVEVIRGL